MKDIDLSGLRFPSDSISVAKLRAMYPERFDIGMTNDGKAQPTYFLHADEAGNASDDVGGILYVERLIALCAYAAAKGVKGPDCELGLLKDELCSRYVEHGIASGEQHAAQLIRDLETNAKRLANQKGV